MWRKAKGNLVVFGTLAAALAGFAACSDDTTPPPVDDKGAIRLQIVHEVNGAPLDLNEPKYKNAAGDTFSVQLLEYYISNIQLVGDVVVDFPGVYYINAAEPTTREIVLAGIPEGHYMTVGFTFGLDAAHNQNGALPSTEANRAMEWPDIWGGGYHYMRLEGRYLVNGRSEGYLTHTGRYADVSRPAEHHFFPIICTMHKNVLAGQTLDVELAMEILEWYETPNTIPLSEHGSIMDNFAAQVRIQENGAEGVLFEARTPNGRAR